MMVGVEFPGDHNQTVKDVQHRVYCDVIVGWVQELFRRGTAWAAGLPPTR